MTKPSVKNALIGIGAYYLSIVVPAYLALPYGKLTSNIIYSGSFEAGVLLPLVTYLPKALCAYGAGTLVVWLVESEHPILWAFVPTALYLIFPPRYHWARPLGFVDREMQVAAIIYPTIACILGAAVGQRLLVAASRSDRP